VKLPPLEYLRVTTLDEAFEVLVADEDAKVMAGGQSLIPLLALRLARPTVLVDVTGLGLDGVQLAPVGSTAPHRLGALVRQRHLELDERVREALPLLVDAVAQVGYPATRNWGTLGGSLAHADPVAELPAVAAALGGLVVAVGPTGSRQIACADLATGYFTTVLEPTEILTEVVLPARGPRHGAAWYEWSPRAHDFPVAGVGVAVELDADGACAVVHGAACGVGGAPLLLSEVVGGAVLGFSPGSVPAQVPPTLLRAVATAVGSAGDGGDEDVVELTSLLAVRAVESALGRAAGAGRREPA
jgi:aerobic carbon-monoxide dehydrogenase medium subunit